VKKDEEFRELNFKYRALHNGDYGYKVINIYNDNVDIYTCRLLEMARIPCLHVIVVCVGRRWALEKYALHQYSKEMFPNP
jgi:hypothetical protein